MRKLYSLLLIIILIPSISSEAREITLDDAFKIALTQTSRSEIIRGRAEVAEQNYYAKRINFLLPEISINGSIPAYSNDQSYRFFGGSTDKSLYETTSLDFNSFIELKQSVPISGGNIVATANLTRTDNKYPDTRFDATDNLFVDELSNQGSFRFSFEQQLFRPSAAKNELANKKDDYEIGRLRKHQEENDLKKEVIEAFLGTLLKDIEQKKNENKFRAAVLQAEIDSMKYNDEVVSEEDYLLSVSSKLDAELAHFEVENELKEKRRELAILLDVDVTQELIPTEPVITNHLDKQSRERLISGWESSVPIQIAEHEFEKAKRTAKYAAAGHGITGDLKANYSFGKQDIESERNLDEISGTRITNKDDIETSGWGVSLEFRLPLWDGGAGGAAVKASEFEAEQARLEYEREKRKARAEIINITNQLDVSFRRLEIISKQVIIARDNLDIAKSRMEDGQISEITFLESEAFLLETREKYIGELKNYFNNRVELESKFLN